MERILKELEHIASSKIATNYDLFSYLLSKTGTFEEVKVITNELEEQGHEFNREMYELLFDLANSYTDGKEIIKKMKRHGFEIDPVFHNRIFWKEKNEKELIEAINYFIKIFKRDPQFDEINNPAMLYYEYRRSVETREKIKTKYTMVNLLTNSSMTDDEFQNQIENTWMNKKINIKDSPKEKPSKNRANREVVKRDTTVAKKAIIFADYLCEVNPEHKNFNSKLTNRNYVEAHHMIPLEFQDRFKYSLDVEANVVSLCVSCHKRLHHAISEQKRDIIDALFKRRQTRLNDCGIGIKLKELYSMYKI
ncbi:HNH endonuclease [Bacillus piscicola]|uniref:HNH endonuclease n=1 Tax=Bacillus piscicola TaxID=1632684 RepID=UPI001F08FC4E|nr:hypothetical protein [Bacillus piscicola]